jgi:hypothetical protein
MMATGFPSLSQVLAKGFRHAGPRLHPITFRQGVKAQPSIQASAFKPSSFAISVTFRPAAFIR